MQGFQKVVGHQEIITHLQNAISMNKVSHAYLFGGESGSGKKMMASLFAMTLQCEKHGVEPCMECPSCKKAQSQNHPDIIYVKNFVSKKSEKSYSEETDDCGKLFSETGKTEVLNDEKPISREGDFLVLEVGNSAPIDPNNYLKNIIDLKTPIVIYGEKQTDIIPVMHAALKIGVPYVPVDVSYPIERLMDICNQVEPGVVFNFSNKEINNNLLVYKQNDLTQIFNNYIDKQSNKNFWCHDNDICYILFTSGSTGKPKGVPITKKNLITFSDWFVEYCKSDNHQVVLNQVSYSFDVSVIPLYIYLSMGASLYSIDKGLMNNASILYSSFVNSGLTDWVSTPSFFELCSYEDTFSNVILSKLNKFIFAGEILRKDTVKTIYQKFGDYSIVINGYGPTETTVLVSAVYINNDMLNDIKTLPVGKINKYLNFYIDKGYVTTNS